MSVILNLPPCVRRIIYRDISGHVSSIVCTPSVDSTATDVPSSIALLSLIPQVVSEAACLECAASGGNNTVSIASLPSPISYPPVPTKPKVTIQDDGTLIYPQASWEPPPEPEGYKRKLNDPTSKEAWVFIPTRPPCKHRIIKMYESPTCGCTQMSVTCYLHAEEINACHCIHCPADKN